MPVVEKQELRQELRVFSLPQLPATSSPSLDPPSLFPQIQLCPSSCHRQEVKKGIVNPTTTALHPSSLLPLGTWVKPSCRALSTGPHLTLHHDLPRN